jgi:hypothetical protein
MKKDITFIVAGHSESRLGFNPGPSECGHITDGIVLNHGDVLATIDNELPERFEMMKCSTAELNLRMTQLRELKRRLLPMGYEVSEWENPLKRTHIWRFTLC